MTTDCRRLLQRLAFSESCHFSWDMFPANTMAYDTQPCREWAKRAVGRCQGGAIIHHHFVGHAGKLSKEDPRCVVGKELGCIFLQDSCEFPCFPFLPGGFFRLIMIPVPQYLCEEHIRNLVCLGGPQEKMSIFLIAPGPILCSLIHSNSSQYDLCKVSLKKMTPYSPTECTKWPFCFAGNAVFPANCSI